MAYQCPGTHIPASAGVAGFNWREKGLALPGFTFPLLNLGWRSWGLGSTEATAGKGRAGSRSVALTLATVAGSQQRFLVLAVVCKGRRNGETPPGSSFCF